MLVESLASSPCSNMLANGMQIRNKPKEKLFEQISEEERRSVFLLIDVLTSLRSAIFSHSDEELRLKLVEVATTLVSNYALLLIFVSVTQDDAEATAMWGFLTEALEDRSKEVSGLVVDYWIDAKDVIAHALTDLPSRPWLLAVMRQHAMVISKRCLYTSYEQSWERADSEAMTTNRYRVGAQDALASLFAFFCGARMAEELLTVFSELVKDHSQVFAMELFLFAMRAFLPSLSESSSLKYLQQVRCNTGS